MATKINFGKCKGMTLEEILDTHPKYLKYLNAYDFVYDKSSGLVETVDKVDEYNKWIWDNKPDLIKESRALCSDRKLCLYSITPLVEGSNMKVHKCCVEWIKARSEKNI